MDMPDWRASLGLTQHQAAEALGVSRALIAMIEAGQRRLDRRTDYAMRWIAHQRAQDAPPSPPSVDERIAGITDRLGQIEATVAGHDVRLAHVAADVACLEETALDNLTDGERQALRQLLQRVAALEARPRPAPALAAKRAPTPEDEDAEFAAAKKAALERMRQDFS